MIGLFLYYWNVCIMIKAHSLEIRSPLVQSPIPTVILKSIHVNIKETTCSHESAALQFRGQNFNTAQQDVEVSKSIGLQPRV